jgi:hypothetical protein
MGKRNSKGNHASLSEFETKLASEVAIWKDYYMAPGHTMAAEAGTVLIEFSPKKEFEKLTEIAQKNFAKIAG